MDRETFVDGPLVSQVIAVTGLGGADRIEAAAAAVAVACADGAGGRARSVLLVDLRERPSKSRPGLLATPAARELEAHCRDIPGLTVRARGHLCFGTAVGTWDEALGAALEVVALAEVAILLVEPARLRDAIAALAGSSRTPAALVRADLDRDRALVGLLVDELRGAGRRVKVWTRRPGGIAARRALAGLDPGGWVAERAARAHRGLLSLDPPNRTAPRLPIPSPGAASLPPVWTHHTGDRKSPPGSAWEAEALDRPGGSRLSEAGQAAPLLLGAAIVVIALALILVAVGSGATAKARLQRAADLGALSAARSMRDDFDRLFVPARRADGSANPAHLSRDQYLERARDQASRAVGLNEAPSDAAEIRFPDAESFAPLRVSVEISAEVRDERSGGAADTTRVDAEAVVSPSTAPVAGSGGCPARASGGGYGGPLACRQGTPMRPDVAAAFDRMSQAASAAGVTLLVNSGFRSDAEQAVLFAANPDPRMVAPPGHSLHRCGTELDLGPEGAYGWLAANADRFGFLQRYSWEAWHYGYTAGPEPCTAAGESGGLNPGGLEPGGGIDRSAGDGRATGSPGLPGFVPAPYREPLERAAARHGVSAALLAAQLMAESNFNPNAVSPVGAQGIAQFMPGTAAAYGLDDPFDPVAAIDAQARLMADLLGQFGGSIQLALAAYNAGPAPVLACSCVPGYPETQAYVARIIGLLDGAGALYAPASLLEVRLVG